MNTEVVKNVVQMVFDNNSFEKNAGATLQTLEKLKDALNFEGAVKGLENLGISAKNSGMDALYNGVYKVKDGFNALDVIATRVLQNITDKVQSVATNLAKQITIAPLQAGLQEYETQINSVQTILANTNDALIENGLTTEHDRIEKVNGVLDELNHYADMTIYNFTEMTRNIGTFTAAGVELDTAATAIKGIANLAAMSGSNSQQASTAMYQLSQAIASGSVKLQDWNSVVNAGMGGKLFQNELIDTAKAMGVADEQFIALTEGATTFRESLSSGWISAEVLTNTLEKFTAGSEGYTKSQVEQMQQLWRARGYSEKQIESLTGSITVLNEEQEANLRTKWAEKGFSDEQIDHILSMGTAATDAATKVKTFTQLLDTVGEALQSGWTQSWEYIIGDFEQAKMLWTEVSDIMNTYIGQSADSRNAVLAEWSKAAYSYNEAGQLIRTADGSIVEGGKMVAEEMGGRELVIQGLRNAFQGLFEIALQFSEAWNNGFWKKGTDDDISITGQKLIDLSRQFYNFTKNFKESLTGPDGPTELLKNLRGSFDTFASSMRTAFDGIKNVGSSIGNIFKALFGSSIFSVDTINSLLNMFSGITNRIRDFGVIMQQNFGGDVNQNGMLTFFNSLRNIFERLLTIKFDLVTKTFDTLRDIFLHLIAPFGTVGELMGTVGEKINTFADALKILTTNSDGLSKIEGIFSGIADGFNKFNDSLSEIFKITTNGSVTGIEAFFNQLIAIMKGDYANIDLFSAFQKVIESILNVIKAVVSVATPIIQAFTNVFGPFLTQFIIYLTQIIDRIHNFTSSLVLNKDTMEGVYNLFHGVFSVLKSVSSLLMSGFITAWDNLGKILGDILPDGKTFTDTLTEWGTKLDGVAEVINTLVSGEDGVPTLNELIGKITDKFISFFGSLKDINLLEKVSTLFKAIGDGIKHALGGTEDMTLLDTLLDGIKGFLQRLKDVLSGDNGEIDFVKVLEAGGIGLALKKLIDFIKDFKDRTNDLKGIFGFVDDFKEIFESLSETFADWTKAQNIKFIATAMLELAAAMFILSMIDTVALGQSIVAMSAMFQMIERVLVVSSSIDKGKVAAAAGAFAAMGTAILEMAVSVAIIGSMDLGSIIKGLGGIAALMIMMVKVVQELAEVEGDLPKVAGTLIGLAIALNLLIIPIKILGGMDLPSLAKGLGAVALMMAGLVTAAVILGDRVIGSDLAKACVGLVLMAEAIKILSKSVVMVANLEWEDIAKGLAVMAVGLAAMVIAASEIQKKMLGDDLITLGASLLMLGAAMMMLTASAKGLVGIEWEDLGKLAAVLAGALFMLGIAAATINGPNLFLIGSGMLAVAEAIALLVGVLMTAQVLGPICMGIGAGLQGIAISLESFAHHAAAEAFLQFLKDAILFLPQLAVALASALIEMVVALGNGAAQIVGAIVNLGKAILQGIRELLPEIGATILEFLVQVAEIFINFVTTEAPRFFEALTIFFDQLWAFLTGQIPNFFVWLTTLFTELFTFLQTQGPLLVETIRLFLDTILQAIITEAPRIGETFLALLNTLLTVIQTAIPQISETLLNLLLTLLQQLAAFVPQIAQAAMDILLGFLNTVAANIGQITEAAFSIAIAFMDGITQKMPELVDSAFKLIIGFIDGLAQAIEDNHDALFDAIGHLITAIVDAIIDGIKDIAKGAGDLIGGFLDEFDLNKIGDALSTAGTNLVNGIIGGISSAASDLCTEVTNLANGALNALGIGLEEHSPSKAGFRAGAFLGEGVRLGVQNVSKDVISSVGLMASGAIDALSSLSESDIGIGTTITPVIDASNIQNGFESYADNFDNIIAGTAEIDANIEANNLLKNQLADFIASKNDYSDILNVVNSVRSDINNLSDAISNIQIIMDSGLLVGSISSSMDSALGMRQILANRGVI